MVSLSKTHSYARHSSYPRESWFSSLYQALVFLWKHMSLCKRAGDMVSFSSFLSVRENQDTSFPAFNKETSAAELGKINGGGARAQDHPGPQLPRIFWASPSIQSLPLKRGTFLKWIHQSVWKCSTRHYLGFNGYQLSTVWKISERNAKLQRIQAYSHLTRICFFHAWENVGNYWNVYHCDGSDQQQWSNFCLLQFANKLMFAASTSLMGSWHQCQSSSLSVYLHKFALVWC